MSECLQRRLTAALAPARVTAGRTMQTGDQRQKNDIGGEEGKEKRENRTRCFGFISVEP